MSASDRTALWDRLDAAGLVEGTAPSPASDAAPWYVRAMVGIAGWIAACFLLAFIGGAVAFAFRTGGASVTVGLALCAAAIALLWSFAAREFVAQFALALSLAGQAMVVVGLFALFPRQDRVVYAIIMAFELALALAVPYSIHRTWSALVAAMALLFALITLHVSFLFPALVAAGFVAVELNEAKLARHADIWQPVSAGLALSLLLLVPATLAFSLFGELVGPRALHDTSTAWRGSALVALVLVATVALLLARNGVRLGGRVGRRHAGRVHGARRCVAGPGDHRRGDRRHRGVCVGSPRAGGAGPRRAGGDTRSSLLLARSERCSRNPPR